MGVGGDGKRGAMGKSWQLGSPTWRYSSCRMLYNGINMARRDLSANWYFGSLRYGWRISGDYAVESGIFGGAFSLAEAAH